jgi:hypothetical protein
MGEAPGCLRHSWLPSRTQLRILLVTTVGDKERTRSGVASRPPKASSKPSTVFAEGRPFGVAKDASASKSVSHFGTPGRVNRIRFRRSEERFPTLCGARRVFLTHPWRAVLLSRPEPLLSALPSRTLLPSQCRPFGPWPMEGPLSTFASSNAVLDQTESRCRCW